MSTWYRPMNSDINYSDNNDVINADTEQPAATEAEAYIFLHSQF